LETDWLDPNSYYAMTKASATIYCQFAARHYNLNIPTLRLYSVFGPYEDRGRLIPSVITHGLNGDLPPLVDPDICRDFVYVQDVENAYLHLATSQENLSGHVYNLGTGVQTSLRDVVDVATRVFSLSVQPQWGTMPNRSWDTTIWKANNDKLLRSGWVPEFSFETGFQRTVAWFNDHLEFRNYYLKTN
jgi:dolichol-phosphate mannosyltransferase